MLKSSLLKPALFRIAWLVLLLPAASMAQQPQLHPVLLGACESTDGCAVWNFQGATGSGHWQDGAIADLTIEQFAAFDGGSVVIRRVDSSGAAKGLTATYTGTRKGTLVVGKLDWNWPGHGEASTGETDFRAVVLQDFMNVADVPQGKPVDMPDILRVCENVDGCSSWHMNGKQGQGGWDNGAVATLTVARFEDSAVVIRRSDNSGAAKGLSGLYVGTMIDGKIIGIVMFSWPGHAPDGLTAWEATIPTPLPPAMTIDQIHDVVLPPTPLPELPEPPPAAPVETKILAGFDLNGVWMREGTDPKQPEKMSAFQLGDQLRITHLGGRWDMPANALFIEATYNSASTATATVNSPGSADTPLMGHYPSKLVVLDADHFQVSGDLPEYGISERYVRVSSASVQDVQCDPSNSNHISADSAWQRGKIYLRKNDLAAANCWFYVGGRAGSEDALTEYAESFYLGRGVKQNKQLGVAYIRQAAMRGSAEASGDLAALFQAGSVLPQSKQRHDYWLGRYQGTTTTLPHATQFYYNDDWMNVTVRPCESSNPTHVNADDAHAMGLVAWEAESFNLAHCWMHISAAEGNTHAWVYLGLMSAFGFGVQKNLDNAFNYMYHAARQKDEFAEMYLAEFYIRGWGTAKNEDYGKMIGNQVLSLPNGFDAFAMVRGTYVSPSKAALIGETMAMGLLQSATCGDTRTYIERDRDGHWKEEKPSEQTLECMADVGKNNPLPSLTQQPVLDTPEELYPEEPFRYF